MVRAHRSGGSWLSEDRSPGPAHPDKMPPRGSAPWRALSVVLILAWAPPPAAGTCPHPCSCYVPTEVHCTFRSLASVPAGISKDVERINLGFNSIQAVSEASFEGLARLELLMVHGNNIPSIPDGALRDLGSLQVFKFSYNKLRVLTALALRGLRSLVRLHLDHNQLEFLHPHAFRGLTSLRLVHLEGNQLRQLHPGSFATFSLLDHFPLSTVRHLYLAENRLRRLPEAMLRAMPLLDNLLLHGNPWACDCDLRWLPAWAAQAPGVLKCKKDRAYEGGQLCAACSSPRALRGREIHTLQDIPCAKPSIESPLRPNTTLGGGGGGEEEQDEDEDGDHPPPLMALPSPPWTLALNMTDEHGNTVSLACEIERPTGVESVQLNQTESQEIDVNATVALDLACPMTRENYEKLWKLIAYYSEVPVTLRREPPDGHDPGGAAHRYRQDADDADALYYTGVRARVLARPAWVLQPTIHLRLNRRQSTSKRALLSYRARFSWTTSGGDAGRSRGRSWVMIEPGPDVPRAQTVLEGSPCQLGCDVKASESPSIAWVLPDGAVLTASTPDGKFSVLTGGGLRIRSTGRADAGVYQCVARVTDEADRLAYRVLVQPRTAQPTDGHAVVTVPKNAGDPLMLPCRALAVPEAQLSWILPNQRIVHEAANTSRAFVLPDGTLSVPELQAGDGGYYRCVAVNQQGADQLTVGVSVSRKGSGGRASKRGRRPGGRALSRPRGDVVEDEGGSGVGPEDAASGRALHPRDQKVFLHAQEDPKAKKGRRKLKPWKHTEGEPETQVAEGRRVFESRRRVHVASKQINPDQWANILARVRGRNLPRGPEAAVETATAPALSADVTPARPVASPPSVSPAAAAAQRTASPEEFSSSADALLLGEEEPVISPAPASRGPDRGRAGVRTAEDRATSSDLQESVDDHEDDDAFSEKTQGLPRMGVDASSTPPILGPTDEASISDPVRTDDWSTRPMDGWSTRPTDGWSTRPTDGWSTRPTDGWSTRPTDDWSTRPTDDWSTRPTDGWSTRPTDGWSTRPTDGWSTRPTDDWSTRPTDDWSTRPTDDWSTRDAGPAVATEDGPSTAGDAGPVPEPTSLENQSPSAAASLDASDPEPSAVPGWQIRSPSDGDAMEGRASRRATPTPALSVVDSGASGPPGGLPTPGHGEGGPGDPHLPDDGFSTQGTPWVREGTQEGSRKLPEGVTPEGVPKSSRGPETQPQGVESVEPTVWLGSLTDKDTVEVDTVASTPTAALPSAPTTAAAAPSRKRPHGRRRLRPHRFRQRHKPTHKPTASAPTATFLAGPTQDPEAVTPERGGRWLVPTAWGERPAGTPKPVDVEKPAEPVAKGIPRRKHGRRPNRQRHGPSTAAGSPASTTRPKTPTDAAARRPETALVSTTVSQRTGGPRETTSAAAYKTTTPHTHASRGAPREAPPATYTPVSEERETSTSNVPNIHESVTHVTPPSGPGVPTARDVKNEPRPSSFPGTEIWVPPRMAQPGGLQTDTPTTPSLETRTASSSISQDSGDPDLPSEVPPSVALSTRDDVAATSTWSTDVEASSRRAVSTTRGRDPHLLTPAPVEESATPFPPTRLPPLSPTATEPARLPSSRPPPVSTDSEDHVSSNSVEAPAKKEEEEEEEEEEETQPTWRRGNALSTPSPKTDEFHVTPNQEAGKEVSDERTGHNLLRGPEGHHHPDSRLQVVHPPARVPGQPVPPRGTMRPPRWTTRSPFGYPVTAQPPRHGTSRPGVTASPWRAVWDHKPSTTPPTFSRPTPADPWRVTSRPPGFMSRGSDPAHGHSKVVGFNNIPDARAPPSSNGRLPSFSFNGTSTFPQLGVTPKTQTPTSPAPGTGGRAVRPGADNRIRTPTITHVGLGPPAPPSLPRPRTVSPASARVQNIPAAYPTRNAAVPFVTSPGPPSGSFHPSGPRLSSAGGPPASKFWTLGEAPQIITKSPQTVTVAADTDAVIPCEATGKPEPFITWTKVSTGALLTPNTRVQRFQVLRNGTFVIRRVQVQDRGQYLCSAQNLHGVDRWAVLLSVAAQQPHILRASQYQDVTVYLGDTIAMECLARGTPAPQISWIFPDRRVWHSAPPAEEGRVTLHPNRTLSIRDASFADRGVYQCVASNAAGADSLAIRLHVAALPPVIQQDKWQNISLPPGLSIHVHCSAKAAPPPTVRWALPDGTHIRPSQFLRGNLFVFPNGTLYIRHLAPKDSGRYECVAANLVGTARRAVALTVGRRAGAGAGAAAANARITGTSPQRTDVHYGGTLRLDCSASGDPWPRILWRLPSKQMIDTFFSLDPRVRVFTNGTLVVDAVTDKDAGDYLCVARNKVGDDFVVLGVNVVMRPAKIEQKEANDHRVLYGGDLKVDCVASGLPNPEISWSLPDGSLVHPFLQSDDGGGGGGARAKRYVVFNNGTLYFNEVGLREEGDYTCVAENQVGKDEMTVRVKVMTAPPAIRNKTYSVVRVPYGDVVTVACEAKGEPPPKVTWLSPTNKLIPSSSDKYQIYQDGTLLIQKAQRSDSGNYTCVVRNSAGEDRKGVWIQVHVQAPTINGNPDALATVRAVAPAGSRMLIDCRAQGVPTPRVFWAFPEGVILPAPYFGSRVSIHRNGTLDIKSLRKSDAVQLTCIGRNEGGEAKMMVQLTVLDALEKPGFHDPVNEKITAMAGHTISLNCSASGAPPPTLVWVLPNGTELPGGRRLQRFFHKHDGMLHISDLSSGDAGAYRCVARNTAGHTERLVSLKVGLGPDAKKQYRNLVSIANGETLELHCVAPGTSPAGRPARFTWTLPSGVSLQGIQTRGRVSLWDNGTLTVREASVFDRGTYVCKADGEHGASVVNFPVIVIAYPPRITSEPTPVIYTRPGSTVKLNCMAVGLPKAQITWELPDRSHLTAGTQARLYGHRFLHPQGSLTIQQTTQRDAGFYKCTAKNILGTDSKTTYIHVY